MADPETKLVTFKEDPEAPKPVLINAADFNPDLHVEVKKTDPLHPEHRPAGAQHKPGKAEAGKAA